MYGNFPNHNEFRLLTEDEMEILTLEMYEHGSYSPSYGDEKEAMPGIEILDEAEDIQKRKEMMNKAESGAAPSTSNDLSVVFLVFLTFVKWWFTTFISAVRKANEKDAIFYICYF